MICPVCCHKRLVKHCPIHHKQDCEREECLHFIPESELRNANQPITCTKSAVAINQVCIKDFSAWFASPRKEVSVFFIYSYTLHCTLFFCEVISFAKLLTFGNEPCKTIVSFEISSCMVTNFDFCD